LGSLAKEAVEAVKHDIAQTTEQKKEGINWASFYEWKEIHTHWSFFCKTACIAS
jgi:hypothetical protein